MTQPKFAPILATDSVRALSTLPAPGAWSPHRPADFRGRPDAERRPGYGSAGPDQGYALLLAEQLAESVRLGEGEHLDDVVHGTAVLAMRRASLYGRAPVRADLELPLALFSYRDENASEVVRQVRAGLFGGVCHDHQCQQGLVDAVPESTLRLTPAAVTERLAGGGEGALRALL
jgi:hypothetical protein